MHVALGVRNARFPIDRFLLAGGRRNVTIDAGSERGESVPGTLSFASNPNRRGGEWLIRDQFSHRHPAWSSAAGFPETYDRGDPPHILIFRVGKSFHARFANASHLAKLGSGIVPKAIRSNSKGIMAASADLLAAFRVPPQTLLETFEEQAERTPAETFDPSDILDGRKKVFAAVLQRLGQQSFRRKLLAVYGNQCAVSECRTVWVLEAAHITPYRGLKTNAVSNGLLLRADIHTLFDVGLISIEPSQLKIRVSSLLAGSQYAAFEGRAPMLPARTEVRPSAAALSQHYSVFRR